jgi:hypothetical protein
MRRQQVIIVSNRRAFHHLANPVNHRNKRPAVERRDHNRIESLSQIRRFVLVQQIGLVEDEKTRYS